MVYRKTSDHKLGEFTRAIAAIATMATMGPSSTLAPNRPWEIPPSPSSCLLKAIKSLSVDSIASSIAERVADSTVWIVKPFDSHKPISEDNINLAGSGFIVSNSGVGNDPGNIDSANRIITNQHVTNDLYQKDSKSPTIQIDSKSPLYIVKSNGELIGKAIVIASGGWHYNKTITNSYDNKNGHKDLSVLKVIEFAPYMEVAYRKLGLTLGPQSTSSLEKFDTTDASAGPTFGASGAPVFNPQGEVIGLEHTILLLGSKLDIPTPTFGNIKNMALGRNYSTQSAFMHSPKTEAFIIPINGQEVTAALNGAGKTIRTSSSLKLQTSIQVAGFSMDNCTAYTGNLTPIPPLTSPPSAKHPRGKMKLIR